MTALKEASQAHHEYETNFLKGERDTQWAGWYASYVLGRIGDFIAPTLLTERLIGTSGEGDWFEHAVENVLQAL